MSAGLGKLSQGSQRGLAIVSKAMGGLQQQGAKVATSLNEIEKRLEHLRSMRGSLDISRPGEVAKLRAINSELHKLERQQNRMQTMNGSRIKTWGRDAISQIPGFGLASNPLVMAGTAAFMSGKLAMEADRTKTGMQVLAGDAKGGQLYGELTKYANDTIFGNELHQNAQTMLGFGIAAEKIMPSIKMLGDVSMGNKEKLGSLTLAFSQVAAAGRLTGQDLLQFINAGFNPLGVIAEKTGKSVGELKKEMEDGKITFAMVEQAFTDATSAGGRFYNMTQKMAETPYGKLQAFLGSLQTFGVKLGSFLLPLFGKLLDKLSGLLDFINKNGKLTIMILGGLAVAFAAANAEALGAAIGFRLAALSSSTLLAGLSRLVAFLYANPIFAVIGIGLGLLAMHMQNSSEKLAKLREETERLSAIRTDAIGIQAREKERLTELLNTYNDANKPIKERQAALEKMRSTMGEYAKDLRNEKDWLEQGSIAIERYTNKLYNQAVARGMQKHIESLAEKHAAVLNKSEEEYQPGWLANQVMGLSAIADNLDPRQIISGTFFKSVSKSYGEKYNATTKRLKQSDVNESENALMKARRIFDTGGWGQYLMPETGGGAADPYAGLGGGGGGNGSGGSGKSLSESITGGGPRVININGVKFTDKIEIHTMNGQQAIDSLQGQLEEMFLRVLNSGATVQ